MSVNRITATIIAPFLATLGVLVFSAAPALAVAPETPTMEVTSRTPTEASLSGVLNPGTSAEPAQTGTYEFLYKKSAVACTGGARSVQLPVPAEPFGVSETLTGLEPGATYTVCLLAENGAHEKAESTPPVTFALPEETPVTREAKSITGSSATLNGELSPLRSGTAGWEFKYNKVANAGGSCEGEGETTLEAEKMGKGLKVEKLVTGLAPNTEYAFCVVAVNSPSEAVPASPRTFKTALVAAPKVDSESVSTVASTTAMLGAQVNPNGQRTSYSFEYSTKATGETLEDPVTTVAGESTLPAVYEDRTASVPTGTLLAGTTYYYRVVASNATPPAADGTVQSFTTVPAPHGVAVQAITVTTATFTGELTPLNEAVGTKYYFKYNVGASCSGGPTTPEGEDPAGGGTGTALLTEPVTGLQPDVEYTVCLFASNGFGSETSAPVHFGPTLAAAPTVENPNASGVTPTDATLEASVNPNNQKTTNCEFQYGETTSYGTDKPCNPASLEGYGGQGVSLPVSGLTPNTIYHFRVVATNATGTGEVTGEFKTLALVAPAIESESAPVVTPYEAQLETVVNPEYQASTCQFEYGSTEPLLKSGVTTVACNPAQLGTGGGGVGASAIITGLTPKTKYYYRVSATNGTGTTTDTTIEDFETGTPVVPVIESESVSGVTPTGVKFEAQINPSYQETQYVFEYAAHESEVLAGKGKTASGKPVPAGSIAAGLGEHSAASTVIGLEPGETYYYRVIATNATGTVQNTGVIRSFKTLIEPIIGAVEAQSVTSSTAILSGTVNPAGSETSYHFIYIQAAEYTPGAQECAVQPVQLCAYGPHARVTPQSSSIGSDYTTHTTAQIPISELQPGTTYDYALVATNAQEITTIGADQTFTTGPATIQPPTTEPIPTTAPQLPASPFTGTPAPAFIPYTSIAALDTTEAHENKGTGTTKKTKKSKKKKKHTKRKKHNQKKKK
jgi:phosphodiesterase/alkaline phosphatase D-like protein